MKDHRYSSRGPADPGETRPSAVCQRSFDGRGIRIIAGCSGERDGTRRRRPLRLRPSTLRARSSSVSSAWADAATGLPGCSANMAAMRCTRWPITSLKSPTCGKALGVDKSRCFSGLSGYKRLIESGVEAVVIIDVPYFYPEQAKAAVAAGLHVYMAKPVAVDVPGQWRSASPANWRPRSSVFPGGLPDANRSAQHRDRQTNRGRSNRQSCGGYEPVFRRRLA